MDCAYCNHANPDQARYCGGCQARLPENVASQRSLCLELDDQTEYLTPQRTYATEYLQDLSFAAYACLEYGEPLEPLLECYEGVRTRMERFELQVAPAWLSNLYSEQRERPQDSYPRQMSYLIRMGIHLYRNGFDLFEEFRADPQEDLLLEAIRRMQEGNDHLGLAHELLAIRQQALEEEMRRRNLPTRPRAVTAEEPAAEQAAEAA
ncbi:MAG: zinc ribbon domain-containing protein [Candidatus Eremiobacterota bacterium]